MIYCLSCKKRTTCVLRGVNFLVEKELLSGRKDELRS